MNKIEDSFPAIIVAMTLLILMRLVSQGLIPGPVRLVERLMNRVVSFTGQVVWSMPRRVFGLVGVVWLTLIGFAVLASVATLIAIAGGNAIGAIGGLVVSIILWALVVGAWYLVRAVARRRYTPRQLPTRRRER
jgi:hypothetical protein